ncbi:MAG TPA: hypothetical protein VE155_06325 [Pseudonocardiaceae bacterium]|jgi:hypothetical protein|nr:hypothetical protein [Pseudonocardiaceae bacterium]
MAKNKHNHELLPFGAYVDEGECPRCDELRVEKQALGETPHNHRPQPWGRRVNGCLRCLELAAGAPKRESVADRQKRMDDEHAASIRAHFGPGHNERCSYMSQDANGYWSGVCVFGDW